MKILFKIYLAFGMMLALSVGCGTTRKGKHTREEPNFYGSSDTKQKKEETVESEKSDEKEPEPEPSYQDVSTKTFAKALETNDEDKIIDEAGNVLANNPNNVKVLNGLGVFYIKNKKYDLAKYYFTKVLKQDSKNSAVLNNLGVIAISEGEERKAMEYFKQSIDSESSNTAALGNLGTLYLKYEDYGKAVVVLRKAHGYDRSNMAIANNYAVALAGTKDFGRALEVYENLANAKNVSVQFNLALLMAEQKQDFVKAKDLLNKIRFLTTDPGILKKANDVSKWLETRLKR